MPDKPRLYLETTIPSYVVARPSRDIIVLARQQLTRNWWDNERERYELCVSQPVLDEAAEGDPELARQRLELLEPLTRLEVTPEVEQLGREFASALQLPSRAAVDAIHLAVASFYELEYLLTWNYAHLANAHVRRRLEQFAGASGRPVPTICTPEELIEEAEK